MSEIVDLDGDREVEWIKKEEIEVEEQSPVAPGMASYPSALLTKQKEVQWHVPYPTIVAAAAAATTAIERKEREEREKKENQQVPADIDSTLLISNVHSVAPLQKQSAAPPTPKSQRRRQLQPAQADELVVRVKTEPFADLDKDEGNSASTSSERPAPSKRMRRDGAKAEAVKVKTEPLEPDETMAFGSSSSSGSGGAELGAIRQLLSTLQKPVDDDQVFGEHIACELRSIRSASVKKRLKRTIMLALINALEEDS